MFRSSLLFLAAALLSLSAAGCGTSAVDQLHGRWFNSSNSIRFNPDGTALWNSQVNGRLTGTYSFSGEARSASVAQPVRNLTLNLSGPSRTVTGTFEVQLLGSARMRITQVTDAASIRLLDPMLLKRAGAEDKEPQLVTAAQD